MPPKRGAPKVVSTKGKRKPPGKGKKKRKKGKKKPGKYDHLSYLGVNIGMLPKEELEKIAYKVRGHLDQVREERIRFQLERDLLYDLYSSYMELYRGAKIKNEGLIAETNKVNQEAEDSKIIKGIEGKHFRYETQIKATRMDLMGGIREKKLKDELEKYWEYMAMDLDGLSKESDNLVIKHQEEVRKLKLETNDLEEREEDIKREMQQFKNDIRDKMRESLSEMVIIDRNENIEIEERFNDAMYRMSSMFEENFATLKNYYNDIIHNTLSLILTMRDHQEEMLQNNASIEREIEGVNRETKKLKRIVQETKSKFTRSRVQRDQLARMQRSVLTIGREIEGSEKRIQGLLKTYNELLREMESVEAERRYYKDFCFDNKGQ